MAEKEGSKTFQCDFKREGDKRRLGIDVYLGKDQVVVEAVAAEGLAGDWNSKAPAQHKIRAGDIITSVNGVTSDIHRMMQILTEATSLQLSILREQGDAEDAGKQPPAHPKAVMPQQNQPKNQNASQKQSQAKGEAQSNTQKANQKQIALQNQHQMQGKVTQQKSPVISPPTPLQQQQQLSQNQQKGKGPGTSPQQQQLQQKQEPQQLQNQHKGGKGQGPSQQQQQQQQQQGKALPVRPPPKAQSEQQKGGKIAKGGKDAGESLQSQKGKGMPKGKGDSQALGHNLKSAGPLLNMASEPHEEPEIYASNTKGNILTGVTGFIRMFNPVKGWGFLRCKEAGDQDVFLHMKHISGDLLNHAVGHGHSPQGSVGPAVTFDLDTSNPNKPQALRACLHKEGEATGMRDVDQQMPGAKGAGRDQSRKVCRFWMQGCCERGNQCSFLHGEDDPRFGSQEVNSSSRPPGGPGPQSNNHSNWGTMLDSFEEHVPEGKKQQHHLSGPQHISLDGPSMSRRSPPGSQGMSRGGPLDNEDSGGPRGNQGKAHHGYPRPQGNQDGGLLQQMSPAQGSFGPWSGGNDPSALQGGQQVSQLSGPVSRPMQHGQGSSEYLQRPGQLGPASGGSRGIDHFDQGHLNQQNQVGNLFGGTQVQGSNAGSGRGAYNLMPSGPGQAGLHEPQFGSMQGQDWSGQFNHQQGGQGSHRPIGGESFRSSRTPMGGGFDGPLMGGGPGPTGMSSQQLLQQSRADDEALTLLQQALTLDDGSLCRFLRSLVAQRPWVCQAVETLSMDQQGRKGHMVSGGPGAGGSNPRSHWSSTPREQQSHDGYSQYWTGFGDDDLHMGLN